MGTTTSVQVVELKKFPSSTNVKIWDDQGLSRTKEEQNREGYPTIHLMKQGRGEPVTCDVTACDVRWCRNEHFHVSKVRTYSPYRTAGIRSHYRVMDTRTVRMCSLASSGTLRPKDRFCHERALTKPRIKTATWKRPKGIKDRLTINRWRCTASTAEHLWIWDHLNQLDRDQQKEAWGN